MDRPEDIERKLGELVPRGFSEAGLVSVCELVDQLAEEAPTASRGRPRWGIAAGIAALLAGALAWTTSSAERDVAIATVPEVPLVEELPEAELLAQLEGVVAVEEDGEFRTDADGSLHRAWHVRVVNEERFHDPETGSEVRVLRPRDELVLMPVSAF